MEKVSLPPENRFRMTQIDYSPFFSISTGTRNSLGAAGERWLVCEVGEATTNALELMIDVT